jgi:sulfate adenylyltransferase
VGLIPPHGGLLVEGRVDAFRAAELREASRHWPSWDLRPRQLCDLELLLNGGFSPLGSFLGRADYESVCATLRLADGTLFPIPVTLDVPPSLGNELGPGSTLALRDSEGFMLAALHVTETWRPDRRAEALAVYGTDDARHPGVAYLLEGAGQVYVAGRLEGLALPQHHDFQALRHTPSTLRAEFQRLGWRQVIAFQSRNPMHRAHHELTVRAAAEVGAQLLIHPAVGLTAPGDLDHYERVRCYQAILPRYPPHTVMLSLLPLAMRMAGPREALWHAIVRKNHGCTHLIVGRDHAGPGGPGAFYGPYAAQELMRAHEAELGVHMVPFRNMVYVEKWGRFAAEDEAPADARALALSGTDLRRRLAEGGEIPEWFTFPEIAAELRRGHPPRHRQGFTVFFTGLSGAGKSTVAQAVSSRLLESGGRRVTVLDGDVVRKHLSSELGFSREDRDTNIRRIGFVAAEITKNGGIALCAPIAPYDRARKGVREMVAPHGGFVLVHVDAPLEVCEERDRKGLYAKARAGIIPHFTGVSDPYEPPTDAEVVLPTAEIGPREAAQRVILHLEREGYLGPPPPDHAPR